jgi:hypothetical protein
MNAIGDLVPHRAAGPMPWWYEPVGGLFDQFLGAAETDPVLAEWFLRRFSLLDSLYLVPSARLVGRTIRHNMRLWLAEKRAGPRWPSAGWAVSRRRTTARATRSPAAASPAGALLPGCQPGCCRGANRPVTGLWGNEEKEALLGGGPQRQVAQGHRVVDSPGQHPYIPD